jgi:hypothetical protein
MARHTLSNAAEISMVIASTRIRYYAYTSDSTGANVYWSHFALTFLVKLLVRYSKALLHCACMFDIHAAMCNQTSLHCHQRTHDCL